MYSACVEKWRIVVQNFPYNQIGLQHLLGKAVELSAKQRWLGDLFSVWDSVSFVVVLMCCYMLMVWLD